MKERRNYYRILGVQPDAPDDVICGVYRTLMQKLRMHPDLGGDQHNAALINTAWQVLRDPVRRQAYDQQLLNDYDIRQLASAGKPATAQSSGIAGNRRNYYRLLGVQADAVQALIDSAYRTAASSATHNSELVAEAYAVLGDPDLRAQYDTVQTELEPVIGNEPERYIPAISRYCIFCKTPYSPYPGQPAGETCCECGSPIPTGRPAAGSDARSFNRNDLKGPVTLYEYWPGPAQDGLLEEFTPDGLRLKAARQLEPGQIIRVTAEVFDAVASVVHCARRQNSFSFGMALLATSFRAAGVFINTRS